MSGPPIKKVQMRGGARRPHARRTPCTLSVRPRAPTKQMGLWEQPASVAMERSLPVWVLAALVVVVLMLLPLGWLVALSVSGDGGATLASYRAALTDPHLRKALWNTVVLAFWVGLFSLVVGAPMAWLTARTDLPSKRVIRALMLASFVTPPFLGAFAWVMLAGPNAGLLNKVYRNLTGLEDPLVNVFSMPGLIFVVAIYTFPYVFIMIANTLEL